MVVMILMMITKTLMNSKMQTLHESLRPKYERHQGKKKLKPSLWYTYH